MANNCDGAAVMSYGAKLLVKATENGEFMEVGGVTGFNGPQISRGEVETTTLCSAAKEYALDLKDNGTFTANLQTRFGDPAQKLLIEGLNSTGFYYFRLSLPDDGYNGGEVTIDFKARVQSFPVSGAMGQVISTELSLRITGDVEFTYPNP